MSMTLPLMGSTSTPGMPRSCLTSLAYEEEQKCTKSSSERCFAENDALSTHTEEALQRLIDLFAKACTYFGLSVSLKKAKRTCIKTGDSELEVVDDFT
ncbi:hypothetical protein DPMN_181593 [Dreissena polymorpha]|uniref:Uncharacterized protein n=1 Tax=Dreissena polymorpha TaxID=45954 RepID=A0A9D4DFL2_DREPO|nr:hypothetical protein DPMN_181593 [Dreissena polymorpha]